VVAIAIIEALFGVVHIRAWSQQGQAHFQPWKWRYPEHPF
jgi:hypothetical protein